MHLHPVKKHRRARARARIVSHSSTPAAEATAALCTMMTFRLAMLLLLAELSSSAASRPRDHLRGGLAPATTLTAATAEEAQLLVRGMGLNAVDDVRELAASDL
jgi:hypothetical protein